MSGKIDYEEYARKRPHFHCSYRYPAIYHEALKGASGTYADVGAGDGLKLAHSIASGDLAAFENIVACDISSERVARIKEHIPTAIAFVGNAEQLDRPDSSIDFYFSDQVIEHVEDDRRMAADIRRVLTPTGRAVIGSTIKGKGAWYFYRCNGQWVIDPTHLREYRSMQEYCEVFERAGLRVVDKAVEPTMYSVGDLLLRVLALTKIFRTRSDAGNQNALVRKLASLHVRIPRYWLCYVVVERAR